MVHKHKQRASLTLTVPCQFSRTGLHPVTLTFEGSVLIGVHSKCKASKEVEDVAKSLAEKEHRSCTWWKELWWMTFEVLRKKDFYFSPTSLTRELERDPALLACSAGYSDIVDNTMFRALVVAREARRVRKERQPEQPVRHRRDAIERLLMAELGVPSLRVKMGRHDDNSLFIVWIGNRLSLKYYGKGVWKILEPELWLSRDHNATCPVCKGAPRFSAAHAKSEKHRANARDQLLERCENISRRLSPRNFSNQASR